MQWNPEPVAVSDRSDGIRVSDAEREAAVATLRSHYESGRLTFEEFSDRVDEAYAARTDVQLDAALRELPRQASPQPSHRQLSPPDFPTHRHVRRWRRPRAALARFVGVNGICIGVWAASGAGYFWPIWVLIPTGALLASRAIAAGGHEPEDRTADDSALAPPAPRQPDDSQSRRVVMTVLFVDIVNSTAHAVSLGDATWHALLADYERRVDEALTELRGEKLFTKGDEVVAGFILPASAVECALRIRDAAHSLGLDVRAGVHAGEVDRIGNQANGIAMHIGRRVCESAAPGQLLVSSTVHDLLAGSSLTFDDAGERELKGLSGHWHLYEPCR